MSLEEIGKQFGDEVAVHIHDVTDDEKVRLEEQVKCADIGQPTKTSLTE